MSRKIIVNGLDPEEVRIAIVNHSGLLEDFEIESRGVKKNKGNIYKAKVIAVEPALNAAFVDYGADKQGFLTANDVDPKLCGKPANKHYSVDEVLKPGMEFLVQVEKDEVGAKGAVLTTFLSLAGRYTVLMPGSNRSGVSRKIDDESQRKKIKEIAAKLDLPDDIGFIIRTAGVDRTKSELNRDIKVLLRMWENIKKEANRARSPSLILKEQDVVIRALRDYFSDDVDEIILDSDDAYDRANEYFQLVMPKHRSVLTRYVERRPIFHHYKVEEQLDVIYSRNVDLNNGASIVIEPTEALVSIDVNSGKQKQKDQEQTALETNLEAAREIARQLRLRDLGGIIVIDFIDMFARKNKLAVEKRLRDSLKFDKARVKVGRISTNGTLEITRQRIRSALGATVFRRCVTCDGRGSVLGPASHALQVIRKLQDRITRGDLKSAKINLEPQAADILRTEKWSTLQELENRWGVRIDVIPDKSKLPGNHDFTYETDPEAVPYIPPEPDFGPPEYPDDYQPEPDEFDDEDDWDDDEEEDEIAAAEDEPSRGRRQPRGRKSADAPEASDAPEWDMPSFELLDPADVRESKPRKRQARGDDSESRKRGRRGSRGRRKKRGTMNAEEALAGISLESSGSRNVAPSKGDERRSRKPRPQSASGASAAPVKAVPASDPAKARQKTSFFARLFGRKGKSGDGDEAGV